ncbi:hypothetical protein ACS0TY_027000 [Phlomoides rotata]
MGQQVVKRGHYFISGEGDPEDHSSWRSTGEVKRGTPDWKEEEKVHLGEELSDVLLYLVRLSDVCGIDLGKAALRKMDKNASKYPVDVCKGSSEKYFQIHNANRRS